MELQELLTVLPAYQTNRPLEGSVSGLSYNSKTTDKGELFFCLRGKKSNGHEFAPEAVAKGAVALVVEEYLPLPILQVLVPDARRALSLVGRHFYGDPASRLGLVGVTGTNGKTTTTYYIRSVLLPLGRPVGLVGTVINQFAGPPIPSELTTPESLDLWRLLVQAAREDCDWLVMEVSSHALAMGRVEPRDFDLAVVTNVTRDHFDFHETYEAYWESKARLVREGLPEARAGRPRAAVLNADDPDVLRMTEGVEIPVVTYGLEARADVSASAVESGLTGSRFLLHLPGATPTPVFLPMPGRFNIANALAAAAVGWLAGVPLAAIVARLEACQSVPGRVEVIDEGQPFHVLVDFAHNPDALAKLVSLRPEGGGRAILVFGAEGGKDRGKRPLMGQAASGADYVIITSDNMHQEEPMDVAEQLASGLASTPYEIVLDRREAIARAVALAAPGDLLLIAGKGHEQTWVYGGERIPLDDRAEVRKALRNRVVSPT